MEESLETRLARLYERRTFGIKPGLDTIRALFAELGNPQERVAVVHVAGTNGKGSTSEMVQRMLTAHGFRVGLYTSPHLVRVHERFRIDGEQISDDALSACLDDVERACERLVAAGKPQPTFFECTTALCLHWWAKEGVRIAVAEVGMGGRLDATNVLLPICSVITGIALDHTQYLGTTLTAIAGEKAGIFKPNTPVVLGDLPEEAMGVALARANELGCHVTHAPQIVNVRAVSADLRGQTLVLETPSQSYGRVSLPLAGSYQMKNVATALATLEVVCERLGLEPDPKAVKRGLAAAKWPARFSWQRGEPDEILDGGHNPDGAHAIVEALHKLHIDRGVRVVLGMCADKDVIDYLRVLAPVCGKVWTVPFSNPRHMPPAELAERVRGAGVPADRVTPCDTLADALAAARVDALAADRPVLVCGSLFLAGDYLS